MTKTFFFFTLDGTAFDHPDHWAGERLKLRSFAAARRRAHQLADLRGHHVFASWQGWDYRAEPSLVPA